MLGTDKLPETAAFLQSLVETFVIVGAILAGFFGVKAARNKTPSGDTIDLDQLRALLVEHSNEREIRLDAAETIKSVRESFLTEIARVEYNAVRECESLETRVRKLETDCAALRERVRGIEIRGPVPRRTSYREEE